MIYESLGAACLLVALLAYIWERDTYRHASMMRDDRETQIATLQARCDRLIGESSDMRHRWEHAKQENLRLLDDLVKCRRENARTVTESLRGALAKPLRRGRP